MIARMLFLKMMGLVPFAALAGKVDEARAEERSIDLAEFAVAGTIFRRQCWINMFACGLASAPLMPTHQHGSGCWLWCGRWCDYSF